MKLNNQLCYQHKRRREAEAKMKKLTMGKERGGLTIPWIARVCLSKPSGTARSFEEAHADLVGRGRKKGCSRYTITQIRNAFVHVAVGMSKAAVEKTVKLQCGPAAARSARPPALLPAPAAASARPPALVQAPAAACARPPALVPVPAAVNARPPVPKRLLGTAPDWSRRPLTLGPKVTERHPPHP